MNHFLAAAPQAESLCGRVAAMVSVGDYADRPPRPLDDDEENRIEISGRRAGRSGSFARGFFVWNSEVGKTTLGAGFFLFDYVCCNRIVWGADQCTEIRIRHTKGAQDRWLEEVTPVLREYSQASAKPVV